MKKRAKTDQKGFSLIELIVVVAIMAVLVGVLAPAYLRYVEKSRRQTCYYNMDNVVREVQLLAYSDPDYMHDLTAHAESHGGDIYDFVEAGGEVAIPDCPSNGDYSLEFDKDSYIITMRCSMEVHGLPSQGGIGGTPSEDGTE